MRKHKLNKNKRIFNVGKFYNSKAKLKTNKTRQDAEIYQKECNLITEWIFVVHQVTNVKLAAGSGQRIQQRIRL